MSTSDSIAVAALERAMQLAEPELKRALEQYGVSSPGQLPRDLAGQILETALVGVAAASFPGANVDAIRHVVSSFWHPFFGPALARAKSRLSAPADAFEVAEGVDVAIFLAAMGLKVAPFDRKRPRILARPTNKIDEVATDFDSWKSAYVGYSPCEAPFYVLVTDCVRSMFSQITRSPQLEGARVLLDRCRLDSSAATRAFQHGFVMLAREPGDTISTAMQFNESPSIGSVVLHAGWRAGGESHGAPNEGFMPVPLQLVRAAIVDPQVMMWTWKPVGARIRVH